MMRAWLVAVTLLATTGAGPSRNLPVPPIPPPHPPPAQPAPMPDLDATGPGPSGSQGPRVMLQDFRIDRFYQGLGYSPGSHFETSEDKRPIQTPGVTVQLPLQ
jgi:hypothetical protein